MRGGIFGPHRSGGKVVRARLFFDRRKICGRVGGGVSRPDGRWGKLVGSRSFFERQRASGAG